MAAVRAMDTSILRNLVATAWRAFEPSHARARAAGASRDNQMVRPGANSAAASHEASLASLTTPALLLADLIHRMGGAATSSAKGAFVNLRV